MDRTSSRITMEAHQCGGRPCLRGLPIRVVDILERLASGLSPAAILEEMPALEAEDITASLHYAATHLEAVERARIEIDEWMESAERDRRPIPLPERRGGCTRPPAAWQVTSIE